MVDSSVTRADSTSTSRTAAPPSTRTTNSRKDKRKGRRSTRTAPFPRTESGKLFDGGQCALARAQYLEGQRARLRLHPRLVLAAGKVLALLEVRLHRLENRL